jgi:hypothetical protein
MAPHTQARKTIEPELQRPFLSKGEYVYQRLKEKIVINHSVNLMRSLT